MSKIYGVELEKLKSLIGNRNTIWANDVCKILNKHFNPLRPYNSQSSKLVAVMGALGYVLARKEHIYRYKVPSNKFPLTQKRLRLCFTRA